MKQGETVTLRGRVVETVDMGHEQNVCLEPLDAETEGRVWLPESQIKALAPPKNKAVTAPKGTK
jgi:hypothetical protein